jgi:hypothetical protein
MIDRRISKFLFGVFLLGGISTAASKATNVQWNPDSPTQKMCTNLHTMKECNNNKKCFWQPYEPACEGNTSCLHLEEKACNEAKNDGCYWFVPPADMEIGYCFEKGSISGKEESKQ